MRQTVIIHQGDGETIELRGTGTPFVAPPVSLRITIRTRAGH